jgi:hypothetical protein
MSTWVACLIAIGDKSSTTRKALSSLVRFPFSFALLETNETLIIMLQRETTGSLNPFLAILLLRMLCTLDRSIVAFIFASVAVFCLEHYHRKGDLSEDVV